jgi:hypothetical protein
MEKSIQMRTIFHAGDPAGHPYNASGLVGFCHKVILSVQADGG